MACRRRFLRREVAACWRTSGVWTTRRARPTRRSECAAGRSKAQAGVDSASEIREALEEGTANPNALLRLVRYHSEQQDFVTADALLRTYGMQLDLRASPALLDVASEIAMRTGDSPRALELALRWTVIDPDNYRAHLRLGRYLSHSTKDGRAVEAFKKSLDAAESAMARFHLAWAYRRLDNRRQAAEEFRRAKELGVREESLDEAERPKFRKLAEWLKRN